MIPLYHATSESAAQAIVAAGFRDATHHSLEVTGVFLSNKPLGPCEGAKGSVLLEVLLDISTDELFHGFELIQPGWSYREFCVPADVINTRGRIRILPEGDEIYGASLEDPRWWNEYPPGEPQRTFEDLQQFEEVELARRRAKASADAPESNPK